jgi:hypothetical protein
MRTLRVLAILTKRQMTDDGPYLVAALLIPVALTLSTAVWAFFDDPNTGMNRYLPVPTVCLLVTLVVLLCFASYLFGVGHVRADRASGTEPMLLVLPIRRGQIFLAHVMATGLFLLVVVVFLTAIITGAILLDLLPGRHWLGLRLRDWPAGFLADVSACALVIVLLIALVSYCLGLRRAHTASTFLPALDGLPVISALMPLVIIKGFTLLSVFLFGLLLMSLLTSLLVQRGRRVLSVITVGLAGCILISVPLFCSRCLCDVVLAAYAASGTRAVEIRPSGLFTRSLEGDKPSVASGGIHEEHSIAVSSYQCLGIPNPLSLLGIVDSMEPHLPPPLIVADSSGAYRGALHFDAALGQMIDRSKIGPLYAGPEGAASVSDESLGRFVSPLLGDGVLYDRGSRRFYTIDAEDQIVRRGEELKDRSWDVITIYSQGYGSRMCSAWLSFMPVAYNRYCRDYIPVLDRSGRIALLDRRTLNIREGAGFLPRPWTLFGHGSGRPRDILDYDVDVVAGGPDNRYAGMVVGSLSRQGTSVTLAVFDKDGREIRTAHSRRDSFESVLVLGKYGLESLHPPVLTLASFFTAYSFEAGATHRALFLMPNSFVALQRDRETRFIFQFFFALLFLLPALVFAGFLSWRVVRDAAVMGLPRRARWLWGVGTLAFGLPAYITYRLTRPRVALVLCRDCGQGRRVDQEACHHCGAGWSVPVLEPPAWRVTSETKPDFSTAR